MTQGTGEQARQRAYTKGQKRRRPSRPSPLQPVNMEEVVRDQVVVSRMVIEPENLRWFILRVVPQKEESVVRVFDLVGVPAAIPTIQRERVRRGKLLKWRAAIAPSYVLVGFPGDGPIPWWNVLRFQIVHKVIVSKEGAPLQVPWRTVYEKDGEIKRGGVEALLPDLDAIRIGASKFMRVWDQYAATDKVRVEVGPFAGFEGKVESVCDGDATILLEIFGRQTTVKMAVGDAVKAA